MGPMANLLGMLPGAGQMKEQLKQVDDRDLDRTAAIIRSMTPAERVTPKIINGSRRVRIANGSGMSVTDVNALLDRFAQAQKMMSQMAGSMGLPGMGPMSKKQRGRQMQAQSKKGKKGKGEGEGRAGPAADGRPRAAARRPARRRASPAACPACRPARGCPT